MSALQTAVVLLCTYVLPAVDRIGSARRTGDVRGSAVMTEEYRLNNYLLKSPIKPTANMVAVKLREKEAGASSGGLLLAASELKVRDGKVVAAGPGRKHPGTGVLLPNTVSTGDYVLCEELEFEGEKVDYCGKKHRLLRDDRVMAKLEGGVMSAEAFRPLQDRLLVRLPKPVEKTMSGIMLAGLEEGVLPSQGVVFAAGPGLLNGKGEYNPNPVRAGEFVIFRQFAGATIDFEDGFKYKIIRAGECLGKW